MNIADLAIMGGKPAFNVDLHVGRPNVGDIDAVLSRIAGALENRWLTNDGPLVRELEARLAEHLGVEHCVAICNGTIALELAVRALGLSGEVIVPSFTFVATVHALRWLNLAPVFCDVDPETHNLDPSKVEALITPQTTGILGVHLWGRPCDVDGLQAIADRHGLELIFDAAHSFDCTHGETYVGNFGHCEVFSFHATKFFNTFEGGALCTNDGDLAQRIRLMRNFGFAGYDDVVSMGTNGKMSEVSAAMGLVGLDSIASFVETNISHYRRYRDRLEGRPELTIIDPAAFGRSNHQYIVVEIAPTSPLSRDMLMRVLWEDGVRARRYFFPGVHNMEPYRSLYPGLGERLPATEALAQSVLVLPTGTSLSGDDVDTVASIICTALENAGEVATRCTALATA